MRKGIYRAREIKREPLTVLSQEFAGQRLVFGIDVAKEGCYGAAVRCTGAVVGIWKWVQPAETQALVEGLLSVFASSVEVVLESSGTYGDALREQLRSRGIAVYQVAPKRVKDAQEMYDGVPSRHDAKSAALLGWLHVQGWSRPWQEVSEERRELRAQLRVLELSQKAERRLLNQLEGLLARHWPELLELMSLDTASVLEMLRQFGGPGGVRRSPQACGQLMRSVGGSFLRREKIEAVVASAQCTSGVAMVSAEEELMRYLADEARRSGRQRRQAERRVQKRVEVQPELSCLAQAVGQVTSAALVTLVGHPQSFANAASLVKALGLNLKEVSSGKRQGQLAITKRGPGRARTWLYLATLRKIQEDAAVRAWYQAKVERDGGLKGKAIVAVMRKLAKALWHVGRGEPFDSSKLFEVTRLALAA